VEKESTEVRRAIGYVLTTTALIACPCHLVLLLPLVLGVLGARALGAELEANIGWLIAATTVYFVSALAGGLYLLDRRAKVEEETAPASSSTDGKSRGLVTGGPTGSGTRAAEESRRAGAGAGRQ
jgi:hypothetical protein